MHFTNSRVSPYSSKAPIDFSKYFTEVETESKVSEVFQYFVVSLEGLERTDFFHGEI